MTRRGRIGTMATGVVTSWAGLFVHNLADLPGQSILSPESLGPLIFSATLFAVWVWWPRVGSWLLLGWAALNVMGAVVTVLPLAFLPFSPAQTAAHYGFHVVYLVTQVPLVVICLIAIRHWKSRER